MTFALFISIFRIADFFITVDKGILKKKSLINEITILSPIDFISLIEENNNEV